MLCGRVHVILSLPPPPLYLHLSPRQQCSDLRENTKRSRTGTCLLLCLHFFFCCCHHRFTSTVSTLWHQTCSVNVETSEARWRRNLELKESDPRRTTQDAKRRRWSTQVSNFWIWVALKDLWGWFLQQTNKDSCKRNQKNPRACWEVSSNWRPWCIF